MPPPLAKAIGLEIKLCLLASAQESASGMCHLPGRPLQSLGPVYTQGESGRAGADGTVAFEGSVSILTKPAGTGLKDRPKHLGAGTMRSCLSPECFQSHTGSQGGLSICVPQTTSFSSLLSCS